MVLTNIQRPNLKPTWINGKFYYQQGSSIFHIMVGSAHPTNIKSGL